MTISNESFMNQTNADSSTRGDDLIAQLKWRYAVKQFDPTRKISVEDWETLKQALILTPSSFGLQPWLFVAVNDPTVREKLLPESWGQKQIVDASHLVVLAQRKGLDSAYVDKFLASVAEVRGVPSSSLDGYRQMMNGTIAAKGPAAVDEWSARQTYIAIGFLLSAAAAIGVDACPMEGINPAKYDEILGREAHGATARAVVTLGYRSADDHYAQAPKVRFPANEVLVEI